MAKASLGLPKSTEQAALPHLTQDDEDSTLCHLLSSWESLILLVSFYFPNGSAPEATPLKETKRSNF